MEFDRAHFIVTRLQKVLAEAGVASRRASEQLILNGSVTVNGEVVSKLGAKVDPQHDRIAVDGRVIKQKRKLYVALNKPPGVVCTRNDPSRRTSIGDLLPREWTDLYSVGRLDRDSEGLIFLTNDGDFCLKLTHPRYGIVKTYEVTVGGRVEAEILQKMVRGVLDKEERLRAAKARVLSANNTRSVLELELTEGKYREIRRLCELLGLTVERLVRTKIGKIRLAELPSGKWRTLTDSEIKSLLA